MYKLIKNFSHPTYLMTIIKTFDIETPNDEGIYHCQLMQLMACSLYDLIKKKIPISYEALDKIMYQILMGLKELHRHKVFHGDIKPENILICGTNKVQQEIINKLAFLKQKKPLQKTNKYGRTNPQNNNIKETLQLIKNALSELKCYENVNFNPKDLSDSFTDYDSSVSVESSLLSVNNDTESLSDTNSDEDPDFFTISSNVTIKIGDMGGCVEIEKKKNKTDTQYYISPEKILGYSQTVSSDIWAFGCTIYELLTHKILFDYHTNFDNTNRYHLYLIIKKLGMFPKSMLLQCKKKDVYFTSDFKYIKGYSTIKRSYIQDDLSPIIDKLNVPIEKKQKIIDIINKSLELDSNLRQTACQLLTNFY
jgi:serine/threonine protein kinase